MQAERQGGHPQNPAGKTCNADEPRASRQVCRQHEAGLRDCTTSGCATLLPAASRAVEASAGHSAGNRSPPAPLSAVLTGMRSMRRRLMPMVMVVREEGQEPQAPASRRYTTGPSISTNSTLPPSAIR